MSAWHSAANFQPSLPVIAFREMRTRLQRPKTHRRYGKARRTDVRERPMDIKELEADGLTKKFQVTVKAVKSL